MEGEKIYDDMCNWADIQTGGYDGDVESISCVSKSKTKLVFRFVVA